jgi:hypothetical protein
VSFRVEAGQRVTGPNGITPDDSLSKKLSRQGFPIEGRLARASVGAALGDGRTTSNVMQDNEPCTFSKVLCPRAQRTSRCYFEVPVLVSVACNHTGYSCFYSWHAQLLGRTCEGFHV